MARLQYILFGCLVDNFGVLVRDGFSGTTVSIDAPDADAVNAALDQTGWGLTDIFVTHHHSDHTAGIEQLKKQHGAKVTGPAAEAERIPGLDNKVSEKDSLHIGEFDIEVIETPGHTNGHISYHIPEEGALFCADVLFSMGCGRLFEGTSAQMWESLNKLNRLPEETRIYCGHEYSVSNAEFALSVEPENVVLQARAVKVRELREAGLPTIPTSLKQERETNPFLRTSQAAIRSHLGMETASDLEVFSRLREMKDNF